jgi:hypothetical protein
VTNDPQALLNDLVRERGGLGCWDAVALGAARRLCAPLVDGADVSPTQISGLLELLPPKTSEAPLDLSLLSDKEFATLDRLRWSVVASVSPCQTSRAGSHRAHSAVRGRGAFAATAWG